MSATLAPERYPDVRAAVDPAATAESIPDVLVAALPYAGRASRELLRSLPDAASRSGAEAEAVQVALTYLTAALLAEALPTLKSEGLPDHTATFDAESPAARAARLRAYATAEVDALRGAPARRTPPTFFRLAEGRYR